MEKVNIIGTACDDHQPSPVPTTGHHSAGQQSTSVGAETAKVTSPQVNAVPPSWSGTTQPWTTACIQAPMSEMIRAMKERRTLRLASTLIRAGRGNCVETLERGMGRGCRETVT